MKIARIERIIDTGEFSTTIEWETIEYQLLEAIKAVDWPPGSGLFTLYPESGKKRGRGSGVKPIKHAFIQYLESVGWNKETELHLDISDESAEDVSNPGPMDVTTFVGDRLFCVEWETGNISSSHRAMNKIALGMLKRVVIGGALILPSRLMAPYLTDRVGNFPELAPYFPLWRSLGNNIDIGLLLVIAVEHDALSETVPRIPKGTSGRALE